MDKYTLLHLAKWSYFPYLYQDHPHHKWPNVEILEGDTPSVIRGVVAQTTPGLVISIKGTQDIRDIFTDLDITQLPFLGGYNVHAGCKKEFKELWPMLKKTTDQQVFVTGHSLGGGIATLIAFAMKTQWGIDPIVVTFGSLRVGDETFVKYYNDLVPNTTRVVHSTDIVPHAPPKKVNYDHVDTLLHLADNGKVISKWKDWFSGIFGETVAVLDGKALANHHITTYMSCIRNI